ncbi:MAG TPA: heme-binding protein [Rhizobiaceae bacterium]|nr:heme-binding protein [Rhizobiaceae bacterium]
MARISLAKANRMISAALAKGKELGLKPLSVSVLDAGGHIIAFQRQDGASNLRYQIATGKAFGALALGIGPRAVNKLAMDRPHFFTGLSGVSEGKIIPVPGGALVKTKSGEIIGAVGVTGDTSDNDEIAAVAGVEAAGFVADAG